MIPVCNVTLASVWCYIALYPDGSIHYEEAGFRLGRCDDRTIRKHILLGWRMVEKANLSLTEVLSSLSGYAPMPELQAGESASACLSLLVEKADQVAVQMGENGDEPTAPVIYVHVVYVFEKCRKPPKTALNHVFHTLLFFDTS